MECKTAQAQLEAYLDNELERSDARELEAHLDGCADCRAVLDRLDELRRSLRDASLRYAAPESLHRRIATDAQALRAAARTHRTIPDWTRIAAACVLAFGAGMASMQLWNPAGATNETAHDLFASHWRALAAASPVDVVSSDRHTVKPWFAGKVAQAPLVRDFAEQGFPLVGGRIDYVGSARVPVLVYRHGQHLIDVFVLPAQTTPPHSVQQEGYALAIAKLGDQPAAIVSDMDAQEAARFAELLAAP